MTLHEEAAKGTRAEQLFKSDIYRDAITKTREAILETWAASPVRDQEGQHELRLMIKLLDDLQGHIVSMVNTGKMASKTIEHESKVKELARKARSGLGSLIGR